MDLTTAHRLVAAVAAAGSLFTFGYALLTGCTL